MGDVRAALQAFSACEMFDYTQHGRCHSDVWICGFATCLWLLDDRTGAAETWSRACDESLDGKFSYSNSGTYGPGLLLWFASAWLDDEGMREHANRLFTKLLNKNRPVMGADDPARLARMLRKEMDLEEALEDYRAANPHGGKTPSPLYVDFEAKALFYAGVVAYGDSQKDLTLQMWRRAGVMEDSSLSFWYHIMKHELPRLEKRES